MEKLMEDIIINVPKSWNDTQKDELATKLEGLGLPSDVRILITNKMDVKFVDADVMDTLRDTTYEFNKNYIDKDDHISGK
jgi:hypothetical protein